MTDFRGTSIQRAIATFLLTEGPQSDLEIDTRCERWLRTDGGGKQAILTLEANGIVAREWGTDEIRNLHTFIVRLTEAGETYAESNRYSNQQGGGCPSCVRLNCVCVVRIFCIGDGPHSLGCHGSHE